MTTVDADAYRKAFVQYLRKGIPIRLGRKEAHPTERYVWRTHGDGKVRSAHRRNEGRIFRWDDPPDTGHPGEDYNCRCEAEPYYEGSTEFAYHELTSGLASSYDRWTDRDFVRHYYFGEGRPVTLLEIGHQREIAEHYAYVVDGEGVLGRLSGQIASAAREKGPGVFTYDFGFSYDFGSVEFSHGDATVAGIFSGVAEERGEMISIHGNTDFMFSDEFKDPLSLRIEPGGTPYAITGNWAASFTAEVLKDEARSTYFHKRK